MTPYLKYFRIFFAISGIVILLVAVGLFFQMSWATNLWPWPDGRLSYMFLASICVAIATPILWVSITGEWGAITGSGLFPFITAGAAGIFFFQLYSSGSGSNLLVYAIGAIVSAVYSIGLALWSRRFALRDTRPAPHAIRISFMLFAGILILAGGALILKLPNIMPWPISIESSVIFGWVFLGAAASYIFAALHPVWNYARAPLLGFLIYDIVIGPPLIGHFANVLPEHRLSLIIYSVVVLYSCLLAAYYLFVDRKTRSWKLQEA